MLLQQYGMYHLINGYESVKVSSKAFSRAFLPEDEDY